MGKIADGSISPPSARAAGPVLSVIVPAHNEAALIGRCLSAVLASDVQKPIECLVVANGCTDDTASRARAFEAEFAAKNWALTVFELPEGGKIGALNHADAHAGAGMRAYLDADVQISSGLLGAAVDALETRAPRYVSGRVQLAPARSWITRAYGRFYQRVPFLRFGVPGFGFFAVNAAGRALWDSFPAIISDDTFVRLQFLPDQRVGVSDPYEWPLVEGFANLVRVRRRQDAGVNELWRKFPEVFANDDKVAFGLRDVARQAAARPIAFAVYSAVALVVRLTPGRDDDWRRGR